MPQKRYLRAAVVCASMVIGGPNSAHAGDALTVLGKNFSKTHCARCHVVDSTNQFAGISSTPSFSLMVNELDDWEDRFLSFHTRLPHPSIVRFKGEPADPNMTLSTVPVILEPADIDAIVAFAKTLKKE